MAKLPAAQNPSQKMDLAPALKMFLRIEAFLVLACALTETYCHLVLHLHGNYIYPLLNKNDSFWDFLVFQDAFQHFHHPLFFTGRTPFPYPAPSAIAYEIFFFFPHSLAFLVGFICLSFLLSGILLGRALLRLRAEPNQTFLFIACSLLLAYPLWFELKQGNIEICVWVLITVGVWAFLKGKNYSSAACFGIAGSMKLFPFVYLGLFLSRRRYREAAFALLVAVVATITSLWLLGGSDISGTWHHVEAGVDYFRHVYALHFRVDESSFDHSLFGLYKRFWPHLRTRGELPGLILNLYLALAATAGTLLYFLKIRYLPFINQVLCLCVASILLPPVSSDYTLMHLYVPWGLLVLLAQDQWNARNRIPGLTAAFVCFAILMAPESEFIYHTVRFGGQIKAVTLLVLMYLALKYPFGPFGPFEPSESLPIAQYHLSRDPAVATAYL